MGTTTAKKSGEKKPAKSKQSAKPAARFDLHKALQQYFGFDKFKGTQEKVIESLLSGRDTFVIMPTGGGKSLCYQLPAMVSEGVAIIVSPLIALMKNQVDLVRSYSSAGAGTMRLDLTLPPPLSGRWQVDTPVQKLTAPTGCP